MDRKCCIFANIPIMTYRNFTSWFSSSVNAYSVNVILSPACWIPQCVHVCRYVYVSSLQWTSLGLISVAKYFVPVMLGTNWFSCISVVEVKQFAMQVRTARSVSIPTLNVEGRTSNAVSLQLKPPSMERRSRSCDDDAKTHPWKTSPEGRCIG